MWIVFAIGSAVFAGVTSILEKCGIRKTDSTVATAIRTIVVLVFAWGMVFLAGSQKELPAIDGKTLVFLILSGLATGASWLCYYKALQDGLASVVIPIDKLSILVTIGFSYVVFHEKLAKKPPSASGASSQVPCSCSFHNKKQQYASTAAFLHIKVPADLPTPGKG